MSTLAIYSDREILAAGLRQVVPSTYRVEVYALKYLGIPVNSPLSPPLLQPPNIPQAKTAIKKYICFIFKIKFCEYCYFAINNQIY